MSILIIEDYTLMYDNDIIIQTGFVRFDLPKVDLTYFRDYSITNVLQIKNLVDNLYIILLYIMI